jgi:hypothetical protein
MLAFVIVVLAGIYLLALGAASLFLPTRASRFLLGFASSRSLHFTEMFFRLVVGAALVVNAPKMSLTPVFNLFGWLLIVTTACLILVPWQWHHRFAQRAVPLFTRQIAWLGFGSLAIGSVILLAVICGSAA